MEISKYNLKRKYYSDCYDNAMQKINHYKSLLLNTDRNDVNKREFYQKQINELLDRLLIFKSHVEYIRPNDDNDEQLRINIIKKFPFIVDKIIPDDVPLVFHGNKEICQVQQIIKSGGLFTPEERGVDFKSFATQIDVTSKSNISTSCEFADQGIDSYMPYGAIFVFLPKPSEYEKVLKTGDSSEVFGGVAGVDFSQEPDRLVAIITTTENKPLLKNCCYSSGLDSNKVITHEEFIKLCLKKYQMQDDEAIHKH